MWTFDYEPSTFNRGSSTNRPENRDPSMRQRLFTPVVGVLMVLFAMAPVMIAWAPYESTMGLVQKIFYFHVPSWMVMFSSAFVCGIGSAVVPVQAKSSGGPRRRVGG